MSDEELEAASRLGQYTYNISILYWSVPFKASTVISKSMVKQSMKAKKNNVPSY